MVALPPSMLPFCTSTKKPVALIGVLDRKDKIMKYSKKKKKTEEEKEQEEEQEEEDMVVPKWRLEKYVSQ